jgi:SAM-dependent methyltransferase
VRPPEAVIWHDLECGRYTVDLPYWRSLTDEAGDPVLDVGAGTGRVALDLAAAGRAVTALDSEAELLAELDRRAAAEGLGVETVAADARGFSLGRTFAIVAVPMQTVQLLGGPRSRARFLECARGHLDPGGLLAMTVVEALDGFEAGLGDDLPLPDVAEYDGCLYASQPVGVRVDAASTVVERRRQTVSPEGERSERRDEVRLDRLDAAQLAGEAAALGFTARSPIEIPATDDHVGSTLVVLTAP